MPAAHLLWWEDRLLGRFRFADICPFSGEGVTRRVGNGGDWLPCTQPDLVWKRLRECLASRFTVFPPGDTNGEGRALALPEPGRGG